MGYAKQFDFDYCMDEMESMIADTVAVHAKARAIECAEQLAALGQEHEEPVESPVDGVGVKHV